MCQSFSILPQLLQTYPDLGISICPEPLHVLQVVRYLPDTKTPVPLHAEHFTFTVYALAFHTISPPQPHRLPILSVLSVVFTMLSVFVVVNNPVKAITTMTDKVINDFFIFT